MAEGGYPSPYVVDSRAPWPPVPPRLRQGQRRATVAQTLLFVLVAVALCGMAIEACFIYRLYQHEPGTSASSSKIIAGEDVPPPPTKPSFDILPSKPVAHLTVGESIVHKNYILAWNMDSDPLLYKMDYNDGRLLILKEGFYYVYSKVSFSDNGIFHHSVELDTKLFAGKSISLLLSRKYSEKISTNRLSNSYLGGVFHLHKDDALFVKVNNASKVVRSKFSENTFGAYMI